MKITAQDLKKLNVIDKIISEPEGGAQNDLKQVASSLKEYIIKTIKELEKISKDELVQERYNKFRKMGQY